MTPSFQPQAILKQISPPVPHAGIHSLSPNYSTTIGRDPSCQVALDPAQNQGVSRRHAEIRPLQTTSGVPGWQLCDLGSANGTYINQRRLEGLHILQPGDRIRFGQTGAEFVFEMQGRMPMATPIRQDALHMSQVIPILSTRQQLFSKAYLVPGVITVLLVVGLFATQGRPGLFNGLLGLYLAAAGFFAVYQVAGKPKPWWLVVGVAAVTIAILMSPLLNVFFLVFRGILPGNTRALGEDPGFVPLFVTSFFGAGMCEELIKALPVFALLWIGRLVKPQWRDAIGVWEPLDGILLGAASSVGFTLLETLGLYVPSQVARVTQIAGQGVGELLGLQLLIPRIIGEIAGHMAYSGYFGYFIGLSVLIPSRRWRILGIGYLSSSFMHALWNSSGVLGIFVQAFAGILAYAFLMAAILKARQLSPQRHQNFATRFFQ